MNEAGVQRLLILKRSSGASRRAQSCTDLLVHVQRFFTFLLGGVGGRLPFVMLKYERTGLGRVKAHGRGLFVYFGL